MSHATFETMDIDEFEDAIRIVTGEMVDLLVSKRKSYGPHSLVKFGEIGIVIRASDKIDRLATMYRDDADANVDGDTRDDTWKDLVGYGLLGLLYSRLQSPDDATQPEFARHTPGTLDVLSSRPIPAYAIDESVHVVVATGLMHGRITRRDWDPERFENPDGWNYTILLDNGTYVNRPTTHLRDAANRAADQHVSDITGA